MNESIKPKEMKSAELNKTQLSDSLKYARDMVRFLEDGNVDQAEHILNKMYRSSENTIFRNVGKLTREIHEAMLEICGDTRLNMVMHQAMPDARHNLSHVIKLTEDAANQTLTAIEQSMPLLNDLNNQALNMQSRILQRDKTRDSGNGQTFSEEEITVFLDRVNATVASININMNTITAAQGFQDLSGQIIQHVSTMVQDVEHSLIGILKINSHCCKDVMNQPDVRSNTGYGPAVPGIQKNDVLNDQDEVDDLLSTLGF